MTLDEIRKYTGYVSNKHVSGRSSTEEEFNLLIKAVNIELFNQEYDKLVQFAAAHDAPLSRVLYNSSSLNEFKSYGSVLVNTAGSVALPNTYRYYLSIYCTDSGKKRNVSVVSDEEFNGAKNNIFSDDKSEMPIAVMGDDIMKIIPIGATLVTLDYLKIPDTPYYDYCIKTSTNEIIYMPIGSYLALSILNPGTTSLYLSGIEIENPVADKDGNPIVFGPSVSQSVEFEFREDKHILLSNMILQKMGINLKDLELYQITNAEAQK